MTAVLAVAERTRLRLRQSFRYTYEDLGSGLPRDLVHRLVVVPPDAHGDQRLLLGAVEVSDPEARITWTTGPTGARECVVRLALVPRVLELAVTVTAERGGPAPLLPAGLLRDPRLLAPTRLTAPDAVLRRLARELGRSELGRSELGRSGDPLVTADRVCAAVHARLAYRPGVTGVRTTAAQAHALGAGVCQDQAHVMLAVCRALGVPCRYVSGHLVGQGGTHAWVEVLVPCGSGARAVAYDPCHDRRAGAGYLTVAVGRDYADVPPTSGWYTGSARGRLTGERLLTAERLPG